ncbi:hypothetical protein D5086_018927 [Populus alba]|uniref:Uncharacterized protein n=1 Tax=Populus alba TaxID=43335 RepID=A0ACC4BSF2_POPAL
MRIIQVVRVANTGIELQSIRVFCEQWYGPFRNGDHLGGCTIRDSAFASTTALKASEEILIAHETAMSGGVLPEMTIHTSSIYLQCTEKYAAI